MTLHKFENDLSLGKKRKTLEDQQGNEASAQGVSSKIRCTDEHATEFRKKPKHDPVESTNQEAEDQVAQVEAVVNGTAERRTKAKKARDQRLDAHEDQLTKLQESSSMIHEEYENMRYDVEKMSIYIDKLDNEMSVLKKAHVRLNNKAARLEGKMNNMIGSYKQVAGSIHGVNELEQEVVGLRARNAVLEHELTEVRSQCKSDQENYDRQIEDLEQRLRASQSRRESDQEAHNTRIDDFMRIVGDSRPIKDLAKSLELLRQDDADMKRALERRDRTVQESVAKSLQDIKNEMLGQFHGRFDTAQRSFDQILGALQVSVRDT
jgi:DNA repair exonuclease SbcCD ATPase subunit